MAVDRQHIRIRNQILILDTLKQEGELSRADISKKIRLSAPSVSSNIDQLLQIGIIREIGEGTSQTGRKPILVELVENFRYIVAIDLSSDNIKIALGNLSGKLIKESRIPLESGFITRKKLDQALEEIHNLLDSYDISTESVLKIAIGSPGVIDKKTGFYTNAPRIEDYKDLNIGKFFSDEFKVETIVKNDIDLASIGEQSYGAIGECKNFIYLFADYGVGAGMVFDNKIHEGIHGTAGDIGYMITRMMGENNHISPEILDTVGSIDGIVKKVNKDIKAGKPTLLREIAKEKKDKVTFEDFKSALLLGDDYCIDIMEQVVEVWIMVTANLAILLDVETVIIGGELSYLNRHFIHPIQERINNYIPYKVCVQTSSLDNEAVIYGAFSVMLDGVFNDIITI